MSAGKVMLRLFPIANGMTANGSWLGSRRGAGFE